MKEHIIDDFSRLYQALYGELVSYFRHRLPNANDAEDFAQRTFERVLRQHDVRTPEHLLRVVASGLLKNEYRDRANDPTRPDFEERQWSGVRDRRIALTNALRGTEDWGVSATAPSNSPNIDQIASPTYDFEDADFTEAHDTAVRGLGVELRDAYILSELRGLTSRESGPLLGVSHVTAATRRELATSAIREEIAS